MIWKQGKITWGQITAISATIVAVISLIVSVRTCQRAEQSLELNLQEYEESRRLFFIGTVQDPSRLDLIVVNDLAKVDIVDISFPKDFQVDPIRLIHPKFSINLDKLLPNMQKLVFGRFKQEDDRTVILHTFPQLIPVAIEARYFIKGKLLYNKAIYILDFNYRISSEDVRVGRWKDSQIALGNLSFSYQLRDKEDPENEVEKLWRKLSGKDRDKESPKVSPN